MLAVPDVKHLVTFFSRLQLEAFISTNSVFQSLGQSSDSCFSRKVTYVIAGDLFRGIGVALDVALRAVAQATLQLVGIGARHLGEVEREGMAEIVGPERRDPPSSVSYLGVMPAADLLEQQVDRSGREPTIG